MALLLRGAIKHMPVLLLLTVLGPLFAVLLICLADGSKIERIALFRSDARQVLQAERWRSSSTVWAPPVALADAEDGVLSADRPWEAVRLPDAERQDLTVGPLLSDPANTQEEPPSVVWYRIDLRADPQAARQPILQLYLPRIFVLGSAAIYAGDRMVWKRNKAQILPPYYEPILIDLFDLAQFKLTDGPAVIHIRLAARARDGWALSAPWVAASGALMNAYELRTLLQNGIVMATWVTYWGAGALAFAMYLWRRRKPDAEMYLWFVLLALAMPTVLLSYTTALFIRQHEVVSVWLALAGSFMVSLCIINFYRSSLQLPQTFFGRLTIIIYFILISIISYFYSFM